MDEIAETPVNYRDCPLTPQILKSVTVETFDTEYPEPETL